MSLSPPPSSGGPPSYPMPAYLKFCPGGVTYPRGATAEDAYYDLAEFSTSDSAATSTTAVASPLNRNSPSAATFQSRSPRHASTTISQSTSPTAGGGDPVDLLVHKAKIADDRLRQYALLSGGGDPSTPHFLPSLSVLAAAVFGRLTGVPSTSSKAWADAMVLQYFETTPDEIIPETEEDIYNVKPAAMKTVTETTASVLRRILEHQERQTTPQEMTSLSLRPRPCGYVFKRGDIAWNCRTCQADSTCVICDNCFRNSNHEGHEVYFHRTTPGGCCDCGDAEAWKSEGCCDAHRPSEPSKVEVTVDDPEEAIRMAQKALQEAKENLSNGPTALPPKLAAALGVVIGAAVNCLVQAADGAGIGADPIQWRMRWADEAAKLKNGACCNDDYWIQNPQATVASYLSALAPEVLPNGYRLHLRLHNDDVHTFDEVIDALHEPRQSRRNNSSEGDQQSSSLVQMRDRATDMTHHVDADGQVTVKHYSTINAAMQGFRRLKSRGLHCAVVGTAQVNLEERAKSLCTWLTEISSAHPGAAALVVHALVQVNPKHDLASVGVWQEARTIPPWAGLGQEGELHVCRKRFSAFPPHLPSSYVTREEAEMLHGTAMKLNPTGFVEMTGADPTFYAKVPYRLPAERYRKSPHALWGTLPSLYTDTTPPTSKHPLLHHLMSAQFDARIKNRLTESVHIVDTDLRKQQEADRITASVYAHKLPGLHMISGIGTRRVNEVSPEQPPLPNAMEWRHLLATSSFRAPASPCLLLLLLDPYPTKQFRGAIHALFLSLLTDARLKCRLAAALGVSYRSLSTLFCAGVGTEADTPLGFTVQIFTAGSLVRALGSAPVAEKLLNSDDEEEKESEASIGVFTVPLAHTIVRCIHTNILGATKEVNMILNNTRSGNDDDSQDDGNLGNEGLLPALTYVAGEHPLLTQLPAAPDDGFLDSRSTRHKRLPHLLRDLEYVIETPGTAIRLLLPRKFPVYQGPSLSFRGDDVLTFPAVFARLLRVAQGMDPQKRKISGGHVEYEQNRWLEAFGLSLNFAGTRDALAESLTISNGSSLDTGFADGTYLANIREAMGHMIAALLREMKLWLYREGMLETGLPVPPGGTHGAMDLSQVEALQRSTLHVSGAQLGMPTLAAPSGDTGSNAAINANTIALSCATSVKMTEAQLNLIESALRIESAQRQYRAAEQGPGGPQTPMTCPVMGDWLRVPHSPLAGDSLSFHLPLHRALAKTVRSMCAVVVPEISRLGNPLSWWKLPVLDEVYSNGGAEQSSISLQHPLVPLIRPTLLSSNCRVVWSAGPDCSPQEAQRRRARSRTVSANIAVAKIIHSLADHPIRCLAAAQQIERHLWARNGSATAGMALNYSSTPLCQRFRDLDLTLVQLSAAGLSVGLGARRVFQLLISRFSMDGYLCDPERRTIQSGASSPSSGGSYSSNNTYWINPPRLQDADHAIVLSESFFATLCILVTELPPPPPTSANDDNSLRRSIRRELLHALVAEPRSHSEAMAAASCAVSRRDESDGSAVSSGGASLFRTAFGDVLREIAKQKSPGSSRVSGPPAFELKAECCDEYDPTFFHLRRQEHQHAMDVVARLRKQKFGNNKEAAESSCMPLVCAPPKAHPRFLPCRLILHLQAMDAALRRSLLFALTGGSWLPPAEPKAETYVEGMVTSVNASSTSPGSGEAAMSSSPNSGDVPVMTFGGRRVLRGQSSFLKQSISEGDTSEPFSPDVVAASSVSFLEVLQLLTLQVHTLEECASLHRTLPDLDEEAKLFSSGLSINSYLGRLAHVPESLVDVWALMPYPNGPLSSNGSGANRGSILGLLVALYEHRSDHDVILESGGGQEYGQGDDGHGGARTLASSGLKWLLRFVNALVDGAPTVGAAVKSATTGVPVRAGFGTSPSSNNSGTFWTIDEDVQAKISGMLKNLPDLWPVERKDVSTGAKSNDKSKEARKAAQQRVIEMMKKKQAAFAATITPSPAGEGNKMEDVEDEEADLCIICRCDDADGENNGPLGYLGHVQRSRVAQLRALSELSSIARDFEGSNPLLEKFRVVGHMGCQLRETEAMDSKPLACLQRGSIVTVLKSSMSDKYDILSRRVLVRHAAKDESNRNIVTEGWASVQSSQGYVILSPLISMCYSNSRWGSTRPIIRQCGHAAHLRCVEAHTLSLHQRAAGEQPYDGRFAANIDDGEFLCPLCKQLSNILIPRDNFVDAGNGLSQSMEEVAMKDTDIISTKRKFGSEEEPKVSLRRLLTKGARPTSSKVNKLSEMGQKALKDFGSHLFQAMDVPWERNTPSRRRNQSQWHSAIQRWDYEEEDDGEDDGENINGNSGVRIKSVLRHLRQQHIAWAAVGHSAAALESATRGVEKVLPFGVMSNTSDPWTDYGIQNKDKHPMLLELKRTLAGASGLFEVLIDDVTKELGSGESAVKEPCVIATLIADILEGRSWFLCVAQAHSVDQALRDRFILWSQLTGLMSSMPCHVSRDRQISQRSEARAAAAAMWVVRGVGTEKKSGEPPVPLAVSRMFKAGGSEKTPHIPPGWGTLDPYAFGPEESQPRTPFRPAVASSFLYTPLIAWDLNTFAGAALSMVLVNDIDDLPSSENLLDMARTLLIARIIQSAVTPGGIILPGEMGDVHNETWSPSEVETEGPALSRLVGHCRMKIHDQSLSVETSVRASPEAIKSSAVLSAVGQSILPFARSLLLLLRACAAVMRERQRKNRLESGKENSADRVLDHVIFGSNLMSCEDGFVILKAMNGPMPSSLIDISSSWWSMIDRWLTAAIGWELHHGSMGRNIASLIAPDSHLLRSDYEKPSKEPFNALSSSKKGGTEEGTMMTESEQNNEENDGMEIDDAPTVNGLVRLAEHDADSDEELVEGMELDEEEIAVVGFPEGVIGEVFAVGRHAGANDGGGDSSDDHSSSASEGEGVPSDREFAHVSRSPIVSYQPSLLAQSGVGAVRQGTFFESHSVNSIMSDMSHLGLAHRKDVATFSLVRLPKSFVELYSIVNKVKGREDSTLMDDADDIGSAETAICLLSGAVMRSGSSRRSFTRSSRLPGACTLHARKNGSGIGIFFLVQKCTVLLMHNNKSAYSASLYVDEHGEEDPGLRRGRPLFLNEARYRALENLWRQQGIPREVAQIRSTSDRVIRDNWY